MWRSRHSREKAGAWAVEAVDESGDCRGAQNGWNRFNRRFGDTWPAAAETRAGSILVGSIALVMRPGNRLPPTVRLHSGSVNGAALTNLLRLALGSLAVTGVILLASASSPASAR